MVFFKFRSILTLLALISTPSLFASFYRGSIWTHTDSQGEEHFVYCLGDVHKGHPSNDYQRQQLSRVFKRIDVTNTLAIVEDTATLLGKEWYKIPSDHHSILDNITQFFHEHSVQPVNIEFRNHFHDIQDYLNNRAEHFNFSEFASLLEKYITNIERHLLEAHIYKDDSILSNFYIQSRNAANQHLPCLKEMLSRVKDPKCTHLTISIDTLIHSSSPIIDIRILNALTHNRNKKHIFICAGGAHIKNIEHVLPKLGYTEVQSERYLLTSSLFVLNFFSGSFTALNLDRMFDEFFAHYPQALASKKDDPTQSLGVATSFVAAALNAGGPFAQESAEQDHSTKPDTHYKQPPQPKRTVQSQPFKRNFSPTPRMGFGKPTQSLPMTSKLFAPRSPQPTFFRSFVSRPFKFAALGLAGISALAAYVWFGR